MLYDIVLVSATDQHEPAIDIAHTLFKKIFNLFTLAVLDLHCCTWAFSRCYSLAVVLRFLPEVASLVVEHGL